MSTSPASNHHHTNPPPTAAAPGVAFPGPPAGFQTEAKRWHLLGQSLLGARSYQAALSCLRWGANPHHRPCAGPRVAHNGASRIAEDAQLLQVRNRNEEVTTPPCSGPIRGPLLYVRKDQEKHPRAPQVSMIVIMLTDPRLLGICIELREELFAPSYDFLCESNHKRSCGFRSPKLSSRHTLRLLSQLRIRS